MNPDVWQKISSVFEAALEFEGEAQAAFVARACGGDPALQRQVESLLALHERDDGFLAQPAARLTFSAAADPSPLGRRFGAYQVVEQIGRGGMGAVFRAERADGQYRKQVAIKLVQPGLHSEVLLRRFLTERQILADLDHPNIARLLDGGTADGQPYLVMEYIDGLPIDRYCQVNDLDLAARLRLFVPVCEAVQFAHDRGVVHRDLKPGNILVTRDGTPKLLDFGIAKLVAPAAADRPLDVTATALRPMTPGYASPEQVRAEPVTPRSDVYSLGVVLYELLTGNKPYRLTGRLPHEVERAICEEAPQPLGRALAGRLSGRLRRSIEAVVAMALRKQPERRYPSAAALADDIRRLLGGKAVLARHPFAEQLALRLQERRTALGMAAAVVLLAGGAWWVGHSAKPLPLPVARSLAVLPFESADANPENIVLANGMTLDLTARLGGFQRLTVVTSSAVLPYRESRKRPAEIARELGVGALLLGSVQRQGGQIRLSGRLIDAQSGQVLWAQSYARPSAEVFALETEIARQVGRTLHVEVSPAEQKRLERVSTTNLSAYDYYVRGREYFNRFRSDDNERAIGLFQQALKRDRGYALAHAGLANAYVRKTNEFGGEPRWLKAAEEEGRRAVALDPEAADGYVALGNAYFGQGKYQAAQEQLRRALALNPNSDAALNNMAVICGETGQLADTVRWLKRSLAVNPTLAMTYSNLGASYGVLGEDARAEQLLRQALSIQPDLSQALSRLSILYRLQGRYTEAKQVALEILRGAPDDFIGLATAGDVERRLGHFAQATTYYERLHKRLGPRLQASTVLGFLVRRAGQLDRSNRLLADSEAYDRQQLASGDPSFMLSYDLAAVAAVRGNKAEAVRWLRRAMAAGGRDYRVVEQEAMFADMHDYAPYQAFMAELKALVAADHDRLRAQESRETGL